MTVAPSAKIRPSEVGLARPQRCVTVLARAGKPLTTGEVAELAGMTSLDAISVLTTLFRDGRIQRSKAGGRTAHGDKQRSWRIKPSAAREGR